MENITQNCEKIGWLEKFSHDYIWNTSFNAMIASMPFIMIGMNSDDGVSSTVSTMAAIFGALCFLVLIVRTIMLITSSANSKVSKRRIPTLQLLFPYMLILSGVIANKLYDASLILVWFGIALMAIEILLLFLPKKN